MAERLTAELVTQEIESKVTGRHLETYDDYLRGLRERATARLKEVKTLQELEELEKALQVAGCGFRMKRSGADAGVFSEHPYNPKRVRYLIWGRTNLYGCARIVNLWRVLEVW